MIKKTLSINFSAQDIFSSLRGFHGCVRKAALLLWSTGSDVRPKNEVFILSQFVSNILVSRLVSDGESQAQSCILIDGTTPVLAAHSTDGGKTCREKGGQKAIKCSKCVNSGSQSKCHS